MLSLAERPCEQALAVHSCQLWPPRAAALCSSSHHGLSLLASLCLPFPDLQVEQVLLQYVPEAPSLSWEGCLVYCAIPSTQQICGWMTAMYLFNFNCASQGQCVLVPSSREVVSCWTQGVEGGPRSRKQWVEGAEVQDMKNRRHSNAKAKSVTWQWGCCGDVEEKVRALTAPEPWGSC